MFSKFKFCFYYVFYKQTDMLINRMRTNDVADVKIKTNGFGMAINRSRRQRRLHRQKVVQGSLDDRENPKEKMFEFEVFITYPFQPNTSLHINDVLTSFLSI